MASEWRTATVEEISEKVAMGPFGSSIKVETFVSEGVPVISGQHLRGTRVDDGPGFNFITDEHAQRLSNANVQRGDIVFTHAGNIGQAAYIPDDSEFVRYVISQRQFYMRCDRSKAVPEFVTLYFRSPQGHHQLLANASQVGVPSIAQPVTYLRTIEIPLPPLSEQRAIAHILGTLDDRIELNRRMNETLEAMARGLFKSWFVDFDPVRAKAALRNHAPITPPLRGSRGDKGASPQASRWGESGAMQPPRPWPDIKHQYAPKTPQHAQTLRQNQTNAEGLLWHYLRNKQLGGYKFRRQQPIGPYIADFACLPEKLLIELDGGQHADPNAPGEQRDRFLRQQGYRVLRFWNHEVFADCFGVLERVYEALAGSPPHQPAPDGLASATPPQGGSDWSVDRARAYLDAMDPEIAALFPDCFVDSELGEIPAGWEVKALDNIAVFQNGLALQKFTPEEDEEWLPVVKIAQLRSGKADSGERARAIIRPECIIDDGDIVFSWSGSLMVKVWCGGRAALNQHLFKVTSMNFPKWFFLHCVCSHLDEFQTIAAGKATTMGHIKRHHLSEAMCVVPSGELLAGSDSLFSSLLEKSISMYIQSRLLSILRDEMLPKFISGEIRAPKDRCEPL